ncbi:mannose-1-phosphate guanylyltransferase/mannose-6-phosphate isomerase [Oceanomicrobium pacificus]|uniref:mannose-1-phosphate guanylyltransferase n=1 Tax=Oceanomicrobium pacificus TaxID=2692916 RepID=A0A6B0TZR1_9RHOB|nr:mannose-1-phosphate guanylyltransferase/mannose-6-phosphate isomerase [Oceanomicrobium pacificus]MXU66493.1 mannose-1-phosphate guanylyltransferase/mannose-6-phosphate isomerase [Oceanomicrobium pacificus]
MKTHSFVPVLLSGGAGTRLWPLSRAGHPKQFLALDGADTMLQATLRRLDGLDPAAPVVIAGEDHRFFVAQQMQDMGLTATIILEPVGRNTAPAIGLAACHLPDDAVMLVLPADHVIRDTAALQAAVNAALPLARAGHLVTFGIVPDRPHTGYGYIAKGAALDTGPAGAARVAAFREKPDADTAATYVADGSYLWNSGMFLFTAARYREELAAHAPEMASACAAAMDRAVADLDFLRADADAFAACPSDSIDYAVMEKTGAAVVVPLDAGWSDVGSWDALWDVSAKDAQGNAVTGDVLLQDTRGSYLRSEDRMIAALGLDDMVVVDTKDAVMVAPRDRVEDVKHLVEALRKQARPEAETQREVYRPWGKYDSIDRGERYQVKRITVSPGAKLSVQKHHHRSEHWIVVRGTAEVTCDGETFMLSENQSTYIPLGAIHALRNPGKVPLEMIEVQSGTYLGEDDIVRLEDLYGRAPDGKGNGG